MNSDQVEIITLPKFIDLRGNLSFLEDLSQIPFKIARTYWIYDVPGKQGREGHAFKNTTEFIVPLSGSFTVEVTRGETQTSYLMNQTNKGLLIPKMTWRKITDFISGSVCLVVTNTNFSKEDYIRNFQQYYQEYIQSGYE